MTATEIIEQVREDMCRNYCRYLHEGCVSLSVNDKTFYEENGCLPQCDECPLNRL